MLRITVLAIAALWLGCAPALAEKRVALVIGNSAYKTVPKLTNPINDATLVAEMFKKAGFDSVTTKLDVNIVEMRKALREFGAQTRNADVAVIYYAGHGIELDGNNYLIPTDATLETDTDVLDETFPLDRVLFAVEPAKQLRLVILDACRDNPFAKTMKRTIASRGIGRGLAKVEPNNPNTMIAFAAKAGSTASDGGSNNSPFATALVQHLPAPGLDLRRAFGFVRDDVLKNTGYTQEPYVYGSLGGNDVPLVPAPAVLAAPQPNPQNEVRRDYELALHLGTRDGWDAFLTQYPEGFYANLAKGELNKIVAEEARAAATEKARLAAEEQKRLAAEGAQKAEQAKAAAEAKAAEDDRVAAEKAKQIAQEKAAAAERARVEAERVAAEKAEKAAADKAVADKATAEKAAAGKVAAELAVKQAAAEAIAKEAADEKAKQEKLAALSPSTNRTEQQPQIDIPHALQAELRRVGCNTDAVDGNWSAPSQKALDLFNKHAGTKLDVKTASAEALDAVKGKTGRVCPLVCETGFRADGDRCTKITCRTGYLLSDDGTCEKIEVRKPTAKREELRQQPRPAERANRDTGPMKPQATGQVVCTQQGCRPVTRGCRLEVRTFSQGGQVGGSGGVAVEVCN